MSGNQTSNKGNPASHRMTNPNLKARRARSWAAGQKRKEARRRAQEQRTEVNRGRLDNDESTPWQLAKAVRWGSPSRVAKREKWERRQARDRRRKEGAA